jgi:hypothetical protein
MGRTARRSFLKRCARSGVISPVVQAQFTAAA